MIRAIVTLLVLGFVGMAVLSLLFGLLMPLLALALKVGLVLVVGYLLLRVVSPIPVLGFTMWEYRFPSTSTNCQASPDVAMAALERTT